MSLNNQHLEILCTECYKLLTIVKDTFDSLTKEQFYEAHCSECDKVCYVCKTCHDHNKCTNRGGKTSGLFTQIKSFRKHCRYSEDHKEAATLHHITHTTDIWTNDVVVGCCDNNINKEEECNGTTGTTEQQHIINLNVDCGFGKNSKSPKYYTFESQNPGKGAKFLVANAFDLQPDDISDQEVEFSLCIAKLLTLLPESQQPILAKIMRHAANSKDPMYSIFRKTRVPVTVDDFQCLYTTGNNAIIPNLPIPVAKTTSDGTHAYVELIDVLANELAFGTSFDDAKFCSGKRDDQRDDIVTNISDTNAAQKVFQQLNEMGENDSTESSIKYLWLKEWRDGFDPFNTKASRNQVWINTFTICPNVSETKGRNTYFMSIAGKGSGHHEVELISNNEIEILSKRGIYLFDGNQKKKIKVKLGKIATCVDRPERTSMFQVGDHNGTFSTMWGFAGRIDYSLEENHLPHCFQCRADNLSSALNSIKIESLHSCGICSGWNVLDHKVKCNVPKNYPRNFDSTISLNTPDPPFGREIVISNLLPTRKRKNSKTSEDVPVADEPTQKIPTVQLSIPWLKSSVIFAHHNAKTCRPDSRNKKDCYWNKGNFTSYMRTCGLSSSLITEIYQSAKNGDPTPPLPNTWLDIHALEKCHYAPMHMLFLGHTKSNFDMTSIWLSKHDLKNAFGRQVNIYLDLVKKLRIQKYFAAHALSTTNYGTGVWVSENYVFWARTQKFWFATLSSIHTCNKIKNAEFIAELKMVLRFAVSANAVMSRLMSHSKIIPELECVIKIYMDSMFEFDNWLQKSSAQNKTKEPNFMKANSLGILAAAKAHEFHGPAILHWEGGYAGERKIQDVKPLLAIKRENAEWQKIALQRLYQNEMIDKLMEHTNKKLHNNDFVSRKNENAMKVYKKKSDAEEAVAQKLPLSGLVDRESKVWIACRPPNSTCRSAVMLLGIHFDDDNGEDASSACWVAPIELCGNNKLFDSMESVSEYALEYVLLLPVTQCKADEFMMINKYYAIGHKWTERNSEGGFTKSLINTDIFKDWLMPPIPHDNNTSQINESYVFGNNNVPEDDTMQPL